MTCAKNEEYAVFSDVNGDPSFNSDLITFGGVRRGYWETDS